MKNSVYRGVEGVIKKVDVELPSELGPKEVLIKITHSSLCGTDIHFIPYGAALGHEGVGIVEKVGSEVTQLKVGDRAGGGYLRNVSPPNSSFSIVVLICGYRVVVIALTVPKVKIYIVMNATSSVNPTSTAGPLETTVIPPDHLIFPLYSNIARHWCRVLRP
jgi:hypothetical protein